MSKNNGIKEGGGAVKIAFVKRRFDVVKLKYTVEDDAVDTIKSAYLPFKTTYTDADYANMIKYHVEYNHECIIKDVKILRVFNANCVVDAITYIRNSYFKENNNEYTKK